MKRWVLSGLATLLCICWLAVYQSWLPRSVGQPPSENSRRKEFNGIVVDYQVHRPVGTGNPLNKYEVRGTITNTGSEAFPLLQLRIGDARDFANQSTWRFRSFIKDLCVCAVPGETKKFSVMVENHRSDDLIDIQIWLGGWTGEKRCLGQEGLLDAEGRGTFIAPLRPCANESP